MPGAYCFNWKYFYYYRVVLECGLGSNRIELSFLICVTSENGIEMS